ncbi:hypothetical protein F383_06508 [Gossypium arboreum]|uniref:Uncharacterized protein n=1 Tax=Gossypium arboreum TaxID=29729 RepID=A0A0B0P746_GOSAR|nr:hypothetical protein F383_06508 [Gossypium arboreum]
MNPFGPSRPEVAILQLK